MNYDLQGWYVVLAALLVAGVAGLWRWRRRGLFASMVMFGALALALIGAALTAAHIPTFLFGTFDAATGQADDSWKAAQTIVLTLGFIGVVITGVLGYHRQRTSQDQLALERRSRQHERYAKGSEMLASETPEMRIAGLNVIAALGAEVAIDDELRQTCINLICAYLRKNSPADQGGPASAKRSARSERAAQMRDIARYRVVAEEACRLLPNLLPQAPGRFPRRSKLLGLDLDLRDTEVIDLNVSGRLIGTTRFDEAAFSGDAGFDGATFAGVAGFDGARFAGVAKFSFATFSGHARFDGATFSGHARFGKATFSGVAGFDGATFSGDAGFDGATFAGDARFDGATFAGDARFGGSPGFGGATFSGDAGFGGATFAGDARFDGHARFGGFVGAAFSGAAWFGGARFAGVAGFDEATFSGDAGFDGATFSGDAGFDGATFSGDAGFDGARFVKYPGPEAKDLASAIFETSTPFRGAVFGLSPDTPTDAAPR